MHAGYKYLFSMINIRSFFTFLEHKLVRVYPIWCIFLLFLLPIAFGLIWAILPAFGYFPSLGFTSFTLDPWHSLFARPGLSKAISLTLFTGITASVLSCSLAIFITATFYTSGIYKALQNTLAPILAIPHLSIAAGIAFLLAPSGFIFRIVASIFGWDTPPNLIIMPDSYGLVLILTLCLKEIPFFLFIINGTLTQLNVANSMVVARSMGYHPYTAWFKVIFPQVYVRIKLPIVIVLIFSLSVVDIAVFVAPNAPPPFVIMLLDLFHDPNLEMRLVAASGGLLLVAIISAVIASWWILEKIISFLWNYYMISGGWRGYGMHITKVFSYLILFSVSIMAFASLLMMIIWSFSLSWRFPSILPTRLGLDNWVNCELCSALTNSFLIALIVTLFSLFIVISLLELDKNRRFNPFWFYIPLLVPQIIFLFGFDLLLIYLGMKNFGGVAWAHWMYVMPYVFLILYLPYTRFDKRYEQVSYALGNSKLKTLLKVKLPMLFRPIIYAFAVGFAVSISEYLPTLIPGGGRVSSLSTEMVALASGGDRRIISVTSVFQSILPCLVFIIALALPNIQSRNRRGLSI